MRTALRKSLNQELAEKLLLKDATLGQMAKAFYKNHHEGCNMTFCLVLGLAFGLIVGMSL